MGDFSGEFLIYLTLAAVIGFAAGFLLKRLHSRKTEKALIRELKQTHDKLDSAEGELRRQEALIGDLRNELDTRTQELKTRTDEFAVLAETLKTSEATVDRLETELAQLRDDKDVEIGNLREHIGTLEPLQGQLDESQAERNRLQGELQTLNDQMRIEGQRLKDELAATTAEKTKETARLTTELEELKSVRRELTEKKNDIQRLRQEMQSLAARKDARIEELSRRPAEKDDLKEIKGVGPVLEKTLNRLGVTTFAQIGRFAPEDIDRVSRALGVFPGRIVRDDWIGGARKAYRKKYGKKLD